MGPVLEEEPPVVDEPVEPRAIVGAEATPHREIVGAVQDIDGIHLDAAHVLDEAAEAGRGQPGRARSGQVLALEEQRADRA